jgi:hypothetical protein
MSIARHDTAGPAPARLMACASRLTDRAQQFIGGYGEGTVVLLILVAFVAAWMIFWTISTAPLDTHLDNDEALIWAQHFAFGYKHPPMTGWLFMAWFAVFPRQQWAVDLLNVTNCAVALAITWRLLRDHLDSNAALLGLISLIMVPLYDVKAEVLNANTVMMPFWAATLLFYLRARRGLGVADAFLAGAFASLTMLGKYWAVFLFAGMAVAALVGPGTKRFWRSPAPYVMALGAAVVIAPHVWWMLTDRVSLTFAESVINNTSFRDALVLSAYYVVGAIDEDRRQAWILLWVPLVLPALVNLAVPYRLTPDWTFPNWALLPIVLYGARGLVVDQRSVARAGVFAVIAVLAVLVASPVIAAVRVVRGPDQFRPHFRQVVETAEQLAGKPLHFYAGSADLTAGLYIYMPGAQLMSANPLSADGRARSGARGLLVACLMTDTPCRQMSEALVSAGARTTTVALTRSFLGFSGPPLTVQITVVPPAST